MSELMDNSQGDIDKLNEKKQHDVFVARREARRRKILENAKGRLDKLSGTDRDVSLTNKCRNHSTERYSDPEIEHPEYMSNYNPTYATTTSQIQSNVEWDSSPFMNSTTIPQPSKFENILSSRVHIVVASAFTYILLVLGLNTIVSHSLFVLFLSLESLELVFFRKERPLSPILNMILIMSGINVGKAGLYLKLFGLLNKMLYDLGLFVFCFVASHGLYCGFVRGIIDESFYSF